MLKKRCVERDITKGLRPRWLLPICRIGLWPIYLYIHLLCKHYSLDITPSASMRHAQTQDIINDGTEKQQRLMEWVHNLRFHLVTSQCKETSIFQILYMRGKECIPTNTNNHWSGTLVSTIFRVIFSSKHGYLVLRCLNIHLLKKQQLVSYQA